MYQMAYFGEIDIYVVKNSQIRYLWMLKIHIISVMPFHRFGLKYKLNSFLPTFGPRNYLFTLLKNLISLQLCHLQSKTKFILSHLISLFWNA